MTYILEHHGYPPGGPHSFRPQWYALEKFKDKALAHKELSNLLQRWPKAKDLYRLVHTPD